MPGEVRIVLIGDPKVGKSSIVTSMISEQFQEHAASVIPPVTIPPDATRCGSTVHIVDTSSVHAVIEEEIRLADCIVVVYSMTDDASFRRVSSDWLPLIRSVRKSDAHFPPVIVAGNKCDVKTNNPSEADDFRILLEQFEEVETIVKCSAKSIQEEGGGMIEDIFSFAEKAVNFPIAPLCSNQNNGIVFKPECTHALTRIFHLVDLDNDGLLNDHELNEFERKTFKDPLSPEDIRKIKVKVRENIHKGLENDCLTISGFLFLHKLFMERGRVETVWRVLFTFGYGRDVKLKENYLCPELKVESHQCTELSARGYEFFTALFKKFDRDGDGALNRTELENLFFCSPGIPFPNFPENTVTNENGAVTLQGFLAQWSLAGALEYKTVLRYLAYLGYEGDQRELIYVSERRDSTDSRIDPSHRRTFVCYLFGAPNSGQNAFMSNFLGKKPGSPMGSIKSVCNRVRRPESHDDNYLIIQKIESDQTGPVVSSEERMANCDLACFLWDVQDSNSVTHISKFKNCLRDKDVPWVFIGTNSDGGQDANANEFCRRLEIPVRYISSRQSDDDDLFNWIMHELFAFHQPSPARWATVALATAATVVLAGGMFYFYKQRMRRLL
eukprot:TRINITY_DN6027_c0_g1_i1.p1 TRINITY_DN6027_c0_g1~~TRINITY_DN6027_c0_g1_i1.p1  ORF type:complete len:613 (-),score=120.34 TRINITY_DN6027_c0_g1_i1:39-1877(-)